MPLSIPTARDIERRIVLRLTGQALPLTDLTPISVVRILIRAMVVEEISALWRGLAESLRDWFIDSARGPALDRRLADYGLARPGAVSASGSITVTVSAPTTIGAGVIVRTAPDAAGNQRRYRVAVNTSPVAGDPEGGGWAVATARDIVVEALDPGQAGNTAAGSIIEAESAISNLAAITNPLPLVNGRDAASDAEYRQYFVEWLRSLSGGTRGALVHGLVGWQDPLTGRRVQSIALEEWRGESLLDGGTALRVYVDEGIGGAEPGGATAHPALVEAVRRRIDGEDSQAAPGLRAAGVPTVVEAARSRLCDVSLELDVDSRLDANAVTAAVRHDLSAYVARLPVAGRTISGEVTGQVSLARLARAATNVDGVLRADFSAPVGDVAVPIGMKAFIRGLNIAVRTVV